MLNSNNSTVHNCIGCFGCWIKTPGACVIRDAYGDMGELISKCDKVIIISKCFYDGFSSFIKNVLDRSISYMHPHFAIRNNEKWCEKSRLEWGQSFGIGGGRMLPMLAGVPDGQGPKKRLYEGLETIAANISTATTANNIFISPNIPRFAYKLGAEMGWRKAIKANGLERDDLFIQK